MGTERAIGIPQQAKGATRTWRRPLLDHEQAVPARVVRIDDRERAGKILCTVTEDLLGPIHKSDSDSFLLRLLEFERHPGLGELAPLEGAVVHSGPASFEIGLVPLKLLLRLLLATSAKERLTQQVMHRRVQTVGIHSQSLLERSNGLIPLLQSHSRLP